jgi:hypothetical protein
MRQRKVGDRAVPVLLDGADHAPHQHRHELGHAGHDHMADRVRPEGLLQLSREHVDDDEGGGLRVLELPAHLLRRVERVHVDEDAARLEDAEGHHRIGEPVGRLERHPLACGKPQLLAQVHREGVGHPVDRGEGEIPEHAVRHHGREGDRVPEALRGGVRHVPDAGMIDPRPLTMRHRRSPFFVSIWGDRLTVPAGEGERKKGIRLSGNFDHGRPRCPHHGSGRPFYRTCPIGTGAR